MNEEKDVDIMSVNAFVAANCVSDYYNQMAFEHKDVIYAIKKNIYERAKNG